MHLSDFIKIHDDFITEEQLKDLMGFVKKQNFAEGQVVSDDNTRTLKDNSRIVDVLCLDPLDENMTNVFWFNIMKKLIKIKYLSYANMFNKNYLYTSGIQPPQILRYKPGGQHVPHIDSCDMFNRTLSVIVFLNEEYTGGELVFPKHDNSEILLKVDKKPGRCVICPSNFLFPHTVTPVETGTRYSLVTWIN